MNGNFKKYAGAGIIVGLAALTIGSFAGPALMNSARAGENSSKAADDGVPVHVEKGRQTTQKRIDLNATINKMRESAPKLSLPSNMFEPWWQTMFRDPDSEWLLSNFDIMSSDPERKWSFPLGSGAYIPRVDIDASGPQVKVSAEVPGITEKNLDVSVGDDTVSIKGEKQAETTKKSQDGMQSIERNYGAFERTVVLPCQVDSDKALATLKNGVLTVTAPKKVEEPHNSKKLSIRSE
jgi:HSP20 family molecular chaperone IbpA